MEKQHHDIGYQKQLRREQFAKAQPRRPRRPGPDPISEQLTTLLNLHSIEGENPW